MKKENKKRHGKRLLELKVLDFLQKKNAKNIENYQLNLFDEVNFKAKTTALFHKIDTLTNSKKTKKSGAVSIQRTEGN